ncbi:MAG: hypothetical protein NVS2B1_02610 [Bradyrhizobium sp.]
MKMKLLVTALVIVGFAGSTFTADAKMRKHHKASSMTTGMGSGANKGNAANPSGQGNVGPGTNNNAGPASGGK